MRSTTTTAGLTAINGMLERRFIRFLIVGGFNTAFSYGVYAAAIALGMPYFAASLLSIVLGIVVSFRTQGRFVFRDTAASRFGHFVLCWVFLYAANVAFLRVMLGLGVGAYAAGALAIVPMALLSYLAQRLFVFRSPD